MRMLSCLARDLRASRSSNLTRWDAIGTFPSEARGPIKLTNGGTDEGIWYIPPESSSLWATASSTGIERSFSDNWCNAVAFFDENKRIRTLKIKSGWLSEFCIPCNRAGIVWRVFEATVGNAKNCKLKCALRGSLLGPIWSLIRYFLPWMIDTWWPSSLWSERSGGETTSWLEYGLHCPHPLSRISRGVRSKLLLFILEPRISLWRSWLNNKQGKRSRNWSWRECRAVK